MNRWDQPGIPHRGWQCEDVIDTGDATSTCEMCGNELVRFLHSMSHDKYDQWLEVGCVCAEKMTGDYVGPKARERKLLNRAKRRARWLVRAWRVSHNGNEFLNIREINVVVFMKSNGRWAYKRGQQFSGRSYESADEAKLALFDIMFPV